MILLVPSNTLDYSITFINSAGCEASFLINDVLPSAPISPSFEQTVVLSCNDSDNAEFLATATGGFLGESEFLLDGTPNPDYDPNYNDEYTFYLYNVDPEIITTAQPISVGPAFENLSLGTYYVMVSDALGCEVYDSFEVGAPPPIQAYYYTNPSCSEDNESFGLAFDEFNDQYSYDNANLISDGAIEIEVSGGQGPYTFTVFNSLFVLQNPDIFDAGDGVYKFTIWLQILILFKSQIQMVVCLVDLKKHLIHRQQLKFNHLLMIFYVMVVLVIFN